MLKLSCIIICLALFCSCNHNKTSVEDIISPDSNQSKEIIDSVESYLQNVSEGNIVIDYDYYESFIEKKEKYIADKHQYKLNSSIFRKLRDKEDQSPYYIADSIEISNTYKTFLIIEESVVWLANYTQDYTLIDAMEVYAGPFFLMAKIDPKWHLIKLIEEKDIYSETVEVEVRITPDGKFEKMRHLEKLIDKEDAGFALVKEWLQDTRNEIEVLPVDKDRAVEALLNMQVTTGSPMGAIIYKTGGILVKNGWLRILGSGHPKLDRSLPEWNMGKTFEKYEELPELLLVADDVLGGFFAIDGYTFSGEPGYVYYFAPDTMEWESTGKTYSDFVYWCFHGDLELYYKGFFWKDYESDLQNISGTQAVSFIPFLWTKEAEDINQCTRKVVDIEDIWKMSVGELK